MSPGWSLNGFFTAFAGECFLARRSWGLRVLLLLPAVAVFARLALVKLSEIGKQARESMLGETGKVTANNAYGPCVDGLSTGLTLMFLVLIALAAYTLAADRDSGVIRHVLIRRVSRPALLLSKFLALLLYSLLAALLVFASALGSAGLFWDFAPVVEDGYELIGTAEMHSEIRLGLLLALAPLPACLAFGLLVSCCARTATQSVASALGLTLVLDIFKGLFGDASYYLYAMYYPSLIDESYLKDVAKIVRGYSDVLIEDGVLRLNLLTPGPQTLTFLILAIIVLKKRRM